MARTPLYKTAETEMVSRIASGDWEIGRRLPNEFQLAEEFGVSQGTMRRALISLEGMGYLSRKPGRGTLVATDTPVTAETPAGVALRPVLLDADGAPLSLSPFRGRCDTRRATSEEADAMGTDRVSVMERTLKSGSDRAALETVTVPEALIPALDETAPVELEALLTHHGVVPARLSAEASAEMTDMSKSVALSVDRHTALLVVSTAAYDTRNEIIAHQVLRLAIPGARLSHR